MSRRSSARRRAGLAFIAVSVVLAGFVPYALFGTRVAAMRDQAALARDHPRTTPGVTLLARRAVPLVRWPSVVPLGAPVARLTIPAAGVHGDVVVEGDDEQRLEEGPGHYPGTALPGEEGNMAIAGHRTTWLRPFYNLQAVRPGDVIVVGLGHLRWLYRAVWIRAVAPSDVAVAGAERGWWLTLTTCNPRYSAAERLVVRARLDVAATLAALPGSTRRRAVVRVTHLAPPAKIPPSPATWLLAVWLASAVALGMAFAASWRRTRLAALLLVPSALCVLESYGVAVRLLPGSW